MLNRRNGKIARLPKTVRTAINEMLDDGKPYKTIILKLNELGYPNFTPGNIHHWKNGGYADWQADKFREQKLATIVREAAPRGPGFVSLQVASHQYYQALRDYDPAYLGEALAKHPESYFKLLLTYSRLIKNTAALQDLSRSECGPSIPGGNLTAKSHEASIRVTPTLLRCESVPAFGASQARRSSRRGP